MNVGGTLNLKTLLTDFFIKNEKKCSRIIIIIMITEYKECGITMNQFLEQMKLKYPEDDYTFTARLDPMACGLVPLIPKKEFKNINSYLKNNKTYQVRVIVGIRTDSDDVLGKIERIEPKYFESMDIGKLKPYFEREDLTFDQKYHYFSSKRIYNRLKKKEDVECKHKVTLYKSRIKSSGSLSLNKWINQVMLDINKVDKSKDFRQSEILEQWENKNDCYGNKILNYLDLELKVSSGFFVRQFVRDVSEEMNIPMLAYKITRIKVD